MKKKSSYNIVIFIVILLVSLIVLYLSFYEGEYKNLNKLFKSLSKKYRFSEKDNRNLVLYKKICFISKDIDIVKNLTEYLEIKNYNVFNYMSVRCSYVKDCNKVFILDYTNNNEKELKCIINTKNVIIPYEKIKNSNIENLLLASSGNKINVSEKIEKNTNCYWPFCSILKGKEYDSTLFNAQCYDVPNLYVDDKPFVCYDSQHFIYFFNFSYLRSKYYNETKEFFEKVLFS